MMTLSHFLAAWIASGVTCFFWSNSLHGTPKINNRVICAFCMLVSLVMHVILGPIRLVFLR